MNTFIPFLALATAAAFMTGCSSRGYRQADRTAGSLTEAADGMQNTAATLDAALFALSDLVNETGTNMAPQFEIYSAAVGRLESQARAAGIPSVAMQSEGLDYFETWNKSRADIQDGEARMRSLDRTLLAGAQFESARDNFGKFQVEFAAFMADLDDIRTVLAADLTPGGLDSIRALADRVGASGELMRTTIQNLSAEFRSLGTTLASSAPAS